LLSRPDGDQDELSELTTSKTGVFQHHQLFCPRKGQHKINNKLTDEQVFASALPVDEEEQQECVCVRAVFFIAAVCLCLRVWFF
jgi:hypothetical protein